MMNLEKRIGLFALVGLVVIFSMFAALIKVKACNLSCSSGLAVSLSTYLPFVVSSGGSFPAPTLEMEETPVIPGGGSPTPTATATDSIPIGPTPTGSATSTAVLTQIVSPTFTPEGPPDSTTPTATPTATMDRIAPTQTTTPTTTPSTHSPTSTANPPTQTIAPTPTHTQEPTPQTLTANHTVVGAFANIPETYVRQAAAIKNLFVHQSTGNNIDFLGLECLQGTHDDTENPEAAECLTYTDYYYDRRNWDWRVFPEPMADAAAKTDQWVSIANVEQGNFDVLGMKFCYVDGWNQDFAYYRDKMEQLESSYPTKTFIWTTQALYSGSSIQSNPNLVSACQNIQGFNQSLRSYALNNNKPLFDLAAIESHTPGGELCQFDGCEVLCEEYYEGYGGGGGGHPNYPASIRIAKGYWWLMARISGWDGNP